MAKIIVVNNCSECPLHSKCKIWKKLSDITCGIGINMGFLIGCPLEDYHQEREAALRNSFIEMIGELSKQRENLIKERDETREWVLELRQLLNIQESQDCDGISVAEGWKVLRNRITNTIMELT